MIFGRPYNLWVAVSTAIINLGFVIAGALGYDADALTIAAVNIAAASIIGLIANQPPTVNPGDTITVTTPAGQPNETRTV